MKSFGPAKRNKRPNETGVVVVDPVDRRPDILQAEQQLTAATARTGVAKAERFPKITLTGLLGVASPQLSALGSGAFGSAGLGLAAPLFNAQALGFQQQAAEAQARQALAQYEQTILVAFREVEDALVAVRTAGEQTEAQEAQVRSLRSALHLAEIRYKGGLSNYLDVLTAKRNLFDVELSLTTTRRLRVGIYDPAIQSAGWWMVAWRRRPTQWEPGRHRLAGRIQEPDNRMTPDVLVVSHVKSK